MVNSEAVFYTNSDSTVLKLVCFLSFPHPLVAFSASFVWFVLGRRGDPFNKLADIILFGILFVKSMTLCKPVTCTRSIASGLPLKGILEYVHE